MAASDSETSGTKSAPIIIQSEGSSFKAGIILNETNYDLWSQIMEMHIAEKEKLSFIRGNSQVPSEKDDEYEKWYADNQKVFVLNQRAFSAKQNGRTLSVYYGELTEIFGELDHRDKVIMESENDVESYRKSVQRQRVHIFLAGLDGEFEQVRGEILRKDPIPELEGGYQKEIQTLNFDEDISEDVVVHVPEEGELYEPVNQGVEVDMGSLDISENGEVSEPGNQEVAELDTSSDKHPETKVMAPPPSQSLTPNQSLAENVPEPSRRQLPQRHTRASMEAFPNTSPLYFFVFLFLSFHLPFSCNATCNPIDRAALLHFKSKITHDPSNLLRTWKSSVDCCIKWEGVACDLAGRVVNVSRSGLFSGDDFIIDTSMNGTLSPSLANLSSLQLLDLSNLKYLSGPIPPQLGRLTHLTHLFLDTNSLTGQIPSTFQNLIHLKKLYLSSNRLSGVTPSIFRSLGSLSELGLSGNSLSGSIPATVGGLVSLNKLDLSANKISGSIPAAIGGLNKLTYLDLSDNQITGSIPPSIGRLSELVIVYLNQNKLTGSIPTSIANLKSLQFCRISENRLTGSIPSAIGQLASIQRLILENNQLTGKLPATIGRLTSLTDMFLSNNHFSGEIPSSFGNMKNLQVLDLSKNHLSGPIPPSLAGLANIQTLDLSFNPLGLTTIPVWLQKLKLFKLMLAGTGLMGHLPTWLSSYQPISILDLSSNRLKGSLPSWIGNMTNLSFLNLSNNGFQSTIPPQFKNLTLLMDLDLHSNSLTGGLNPVFAKAVSEPLGHWQSIDLSWNQLVGPIEDDVGDQVAMDSIQQLVLSNNHIGGRIPESVMKLEKLVVFDVSENRLSGCIPEHNVSFPAANFRGNPGLCGVPLPPCKHSCKKE
ncbi:hypothetical protein MRB53_000961 [Persea americana]|uniref:Uncharacterized protein n=1 Tax=Persea americana TaxID=3435 RepID=A0ACC2MRB2_PERAE|nr:hypothetical protein MRB53_000961 [Persea americana]